MIITKGLKYSWRYIVVLLLLEYVILIYCSTVLCRGASEEFGENFNILWSYSAIKSGRDDLIIENIMNFVVFIPVGLLLGLVTHNKLSSFYAGLFVICIGLIISLSVELLQYYFRLGFSELDDIIHNTLGCLIGYFIVLLFKSFFRFLSTAYREK